jgi:hypothetical protein
VKGFGVGDGEVDEIRERFGLESGNILSINVHECEDYRSTIDVVPRRMRNPPPAIAEQVAVKFFGAVQIVDL